MTRFTDHPLEPFMRQKPGGASQPHPVYPPKGHRCYGCAYFKGVPCLGFCYRELLKQGRYFSL